MGNILSFSIFLSYLQQQYIQIELVIAKSINERRKNQMNKETRNVILPFLFLYVVFIGIFVILSVTNSSGALELFTLSFAPLIAFITGMNGFRLFGKEGLVRNDPFHMMNILLSSGLLASCIADILSGSISVIENGQVFYFAYSFVLVMVVLFWAIGIISYLKSASSILGIAGYKRLLHSILIFSSISVSVGFIILIVIPGHQLRTEQIFDIPLTLGYVYIVASLALTFWTFREGSISIPLFLLFSGIGIMLVRHVLWCFLTIYPNSPIQLFLAVVGYLAIGTAISLMYRLEKI